MPANVIPGFLVLGFVVAAAAVDARTHRIPNKLVAAGAILGLVAQAWSAGGDGLLVAAEGLVVGLVVMLPLYMMRVMGAGDAKLMAMVGIFVGPLGVLAAALLTFVAGGVLALVVAAWNGALGRLLWNIRSMLLGSAVNVLTGGPAAVDAPAVSVGNLPYGVAIAVGTSAHVAMAWLGMSLW